MRPASDQPTASHRLTVPEAASTLGVTVDAVRGRIKRGTLSSQKDETGTVYVLLSEGDQPPDQSDDQSRPAADQPELVESLLDQVAYMREQLAQEREANRENRRLLAAALERIPALEAPPEATGGPETASEGTDRGDVPTEGTDEPRRRSWWREFFGIE